MEPAYKIKSLITIGEITIGKIITDEQINEYCKLKNYKLIKIGKIAFEYIKPNGERAALLKAGASRSNIEMEKKIKNKTN